MAIAYVNSNHGSDYTGGAPSSLTAAATSLTTGNAIIVGARWFDPGSSVTVTSVTDTAGNTYSAGPAKFSSGSGEQLIIWFALNVTGHASNVVSVNLSGTVQYWGVGHSQYSGLATSSAYDTTANGSTSGSTLTSSAFTTAQTDELLFTFAQVANVGTTWTAGSGYTIRVQDASQVTVVQDQIVSSIQTGVTAGMTSSDGSSAKSILVATFKAAAGGGGGANPWYYYAQQRQRVERLWKRNGLLWQPSYALRAA
jgi:hypothetical protein